MHKIFSKNLFIGKKVVYLPKCHSTNSVAVQLASMEHVNEGTLVLAEEQLAGRGQRGNAWESEVGKNIVMSLVLRPGFLPPARQFLLTMLVSLAVKKTLDDLGLSHVKVKWPNDVYVGSRKIAGVLIENTLRGSVIETSVVGIGLNVNQDKFSIEKATSMKLESGAETDRNLVLETLTSNIEAYYLQIKGQLGDKILSEYLRNLIGWEEFRSYRDEKGIFEGRILGVSGMGKLRIECASKIKEYDLKEIEFLF